MAKKRKSGLWFWVLVVLVFFLFILSQSEKKEESTSSSSSLATTISVPAFHIEDLRDVSFANCVRIVADVLVLEKKALTDEQLIELSLIHI